MPTLTRFTMQSYDRNRKGDLVADEPRQLSSPQEAIEAAAGVADRKAGVVAYMWRGDPKTGETGAISVLSRFGALPRYAAIALGIEEHAA